MGEWQVARLIPTWGINSDIEAEMRATSATLAVLTVVREFSSALLVPLGASSAKRATVEAFTETSFKDEDGKVVRPDGLIRVAYGKNEWTALVEVKTGQNKLNAEQVNSYLAIARQYGFDAVITISNEFLINDQHPTEGLKVRKNSKVNVYHYSWTRILTTAITCKVHRGVEDPEQAWILGELIRYLDSDSSGVSAFADMGPDWVGVRDGAKNQTLNRSSDEVRDIAQRWDQLVRYNTLRLGAEIGVDVQQVLSKAQRDSKARLAFLVDQLCNDGLLTAELKVPNTVGSIEFEADLRARRLCAGVAVAAPTDRGSKARHTWLLRQLGSNVPGDLTIEAWPRHARIPISVPLAAAREDRDLLEDPEGREVLRYRLVLRADMGVSRATGKKSPGFVDSVNHLIDRFYGDVVQGITPWVPNAPKLRQRSEAPPEKPRDVVDSRPDVNEAIDDAVDTAQSETRDTSDHQQRREQAEPPAEPAPRPGWTRPPHDLSGLAVPPDGGEHRPR